MKLKKGMIVKIIDNLENDSFYLNHVFYITRKIKDIFYECKILDIK